MGESVIVKGICPLCGKPNNCQHGSGKGCWCDNAHFPEELLSRIPKEKRRKVCVCRECLDKFRQEKIIILEKECDRLTHLLGEKEER